MARSNKTIRKYADFALTEFLDEYDVDYKTSGTNIGRGWIGVEECIFCGAGGYHLGINRQSKGVTCFVCGESSMIPRFIKELLKFQDNEWKKVFEIIEKFGGDDQGFDFRETGHETFLPSDLIEIEKAGMKYLTGRNFSDYHIDKYNLRMTGNHSVLKLGEQESKFPWRIIIPIIMNRKLVSFTGRDYTGQQGRYKNPFLEACVIPASSAIYNYDSLKKNETGIVLEGPTDVWRMGDQTCSMQGIKHTKEQVRYLVEKELKKMLILYDKGAYEKSRALANAVSGVVPEVKIIKLNSADDPAKLSDFDAVKLKSELLSL